VIATRIGEEVKLPLTFVKRNRIWVPPRVESPMGEVYVADVSLAISSHVLQLAVKFAVALHRESTAAILISLVSSSSSIPCTYLSDLAAGSKSTNSCHCIRGVGCPMVNKLLFIFMFVCLCLCVKCFRLIVYVSRLFSCIFLTILVICFFTC
jgi:hypothetical protein